MATTPKRTVKTPGATETTPDPAAPAAETTETENTTSTVSEPVAEVVADQTQEQPTPDPAALPDDYEEYLAWKKNMTERSEGPATTATETVSMGTVNGVKRKRPVLGPKGWTQEEY